MSEKATARVLELLRQHSGEAHVSGEAISRELGVSRQAINGSIKRLRSMGYVISSSTKTGYHLDSQPDRMDLDALGEYLPADRLKRVIYYDVTDSTNTRLSELSQQGSDVAPDGTVVIADNQRSGRGRVGRSFFSPPGCGIYISYLIRPHRGEVSGLTDWMDVTCRSAVAVGDAILEAAGIQTQIKWVNDLYLNGRKLCGILTQTELENESSSIRSIIIGIGVNVRQEIRAFPEELRNIATSLRAETSKEIHRAELAAAIIRHLDRLRSSSDKGYYLERYREDCPIPGRMITLTRDRETIQAKALRIDDDFRLVISDSDGSERALSGEEITNVRMT